MNYEKLKFWDIGLIKLASISGILFVVSIWDGFANWAMNTHWVWFLVACIVFAIKPLMTVFKE